MRGALWTLFVALLAWGAWGVFGRVSEGHLPAGLWIAIYFHGVGIAGGAFAMTALGTVLGWRGFDGRLVRIAAAIAAASIAPALMAVWFDLGHMDRAISILTRPQFTSMMAYNAWLYNFFLAVAAVAWFLSFVKDSTWFKPVLCLGILLGVVMPSQSGAFFGVVESRAFWHSPVLPLMFLASAITAGSAVLLGVRLIQGAGEDRQLRTLRNIVLAGLAVYMVFEFAEFSVVLWSPSGHDRAVDLILTGPYWWVFWIVHLGFGTLVPALLYLAKGRGAWLAASFLVAACFLATRLNVLVPGQAVGELAGLQEAFHHPRLDYIYHATGMEYAVGGFLVAVAMIIFAVIRRFERTMSARQDTAEKENLQ
jgi:molybdopterin-containing oxidoreductase family membrane subunit